MWSKAWSKVGDWAAGVFNRDGIQKLKSITIVRKEFTDTLTTINRALSCLKLKITLKEEELFEKF